MVQDDIAEFHDILGDFFSINLWMNVATSNGTFDGMGWISPCQCILIGAQESHQTLGTDAGAVTLDVVKCASGVARASGTTMLASTFNLKSTNDTPVTATLSATRANLVLSAGDRVMVNGGGTMTAVDGVTCALHFRKIGGFRGNE